MTRSGHTDVSTSKDDANKDEPETALEDTKQDDISSAAESEPAFGRPFSDGSLHLQSRS